MSSKLTQILTAGAAICGLAACNNSEVSIDVATCATEGPTVGVAMIVPATGEPQWWLDGADQTSEGVWQGKPAFGPDGMTDHRQSLVVDLNKGTCTLVDEFTGESSIFRIDNTKQPKTPQKRYENLQFAHK